MTAKLELLELGTYTDGTEIHRWNSLGTFAGITQARCDLYRRIGEGAAGTFRISRGKDVWSEYRVSRPRAVLPHYGAAGFTNGGLVPGKVEITRSGATVDF